MYMPRTCAVAAVAGFILTGSALLVSFGKSNFDSQVEKIRGRFLQAPAEVDEAPAEVDEARKLQTKRVLCIFGTQTSNTEFVGQTIVSKAPTVDGCKGIGDVDESAWAAYDGFIVGAPTWHTGADTERSGTAWDAWLYEDAIDLFKSETLKGKPVAVFGLGDAAGYGDNFCDAIQEMHNVFQNIGAKMVGYVPEEGYDHSNSKSVIEKEGQKLFLGCPFDADNQPEKTDERVDQWLSQIKQQGMPL